MIDVAAIVERARQAAQPVGRTLSGSPGGPEGGNERARLERIAQEFESMLLVQVLRGMRNSGRWDDEEGGGETLGAESMFETLDVELATHLSRIQGLGLSKQMLESFDRMNLPGSGTRDAGSGMRDSGSGLTGVDGIMAPPAPPAPPAMPDFDSPAIPHVIGSLSDPGSRIPAPASRTPDPGSRIPDPAERDVTSAFGWRRDPFTGAATFHRGVDLKAAYGEDIQAAGEGRVAFSGQQGGYGTTVLIEHADGTRTRYAHLSVALVGEGDAVGSGQPIGRAGRSGRATGTHLHFEVIGADGRHVDPRMAMARHTGHAAD